MFVFEFEIAVACLFIYFGQAFVFLYCKFKRGSYNLRSILALLIAASN
ncbi:MAG: hypothetical protein LBP59_03780 [Planctomycetaceae bacterium]|nr:hypothetical protein [Planctomycetaceae bacterium]